MDKSKGHIFLAHPIMHL